MVQVTFSPSEVHLVQCILHWSTTMVYPKCHNNNLTLDLSRCSKGWLGFIKMELTRKVQHHIKPRAQHQRLVLVNNLWFQAEIEWLCREQEAERSMKLASSLTQFRQIKMWQRSSRVIWFHKSTSKGEEVYFGSHSCHCGSWHNASTVPAPTLRQRF